MDPTAMAGFKPDQLAAMDPTAMAGFKSESRSNDPTAMAGFKPDQLAAMDPTAMAGFKSDQVAALDPTAMAGFKADQPEQWIKLPWLASSQTRWPPLTQPLWLIQSRSTRGYGCNSNGRIQI